MSARRHIFNIDNLRSLKGLTANTDMSIEQVVNSVHEEIKRLKQYPNVAAPRKQHPNVAIPLENSPKVVVPRVVEQKLSSKERRAETQRRKWAKQAEELDRSLYGAPRD